MGIWRMYAVQRTSVQIFLSIALHEVGPLFVVPNAGTQPDPIGRTLRVVFELHSRHPV